MNDEEIREVLGDLLMSGRMFTAWEQSFIESICDTDKPLTSDQRDKAVEIIREAGL